MYRTRNILAVLLALQLLLALALWLSDSKITGPQSAMPLVTFDQDGVDRIVLEGPEQAVTLARNDGTWVLPEHQDFPVPDNQVTELLDRLEGLQTRLPVASTEAARKRFRVDEEDFERRITLYRGDDRLARVYFGKSPGMRMIYARDDDRNDIHVVKMAAYDVPVEAGDWEDKSLLSLAEKDIRGLEVAGLQIQRANEAGSGEEDPRWQSADLDPEQQLDSDGVDKLARLLAGLRFDSVLGTEDKEEYGLSEPLLELRLRTAESEGGIRYRLGKQADEEVYTLKLSSRPEYFRLAPHTATDLVEAAALDRLLRTGSDQIANPESSDSASTDQPAQ